jgi:N-acetylneuraminic acid mutarotase
MRRAAIGLFALALGNLTCARRDHELSPAISSALHRLSIHGSDGNSLSQRSGARDFSFRAAAWEARLDGDSAAIAIDRVDHSASIALRPLHAPIHFNDTRDERGALIHSSSDGNSAIVLRPDPSGIKEDIVLAQPLGDRLIFSWALDLGPGESARIEADGGVQILASDGKRTFRIPAPIVKQASGALAPDSARFELHDKILTLRTQGLAALDYPIAIDPTVMVDGEVGLRGGNDEGGAGFGSDHLRRQRTSVGIGDWTTPASIPGGRANASGVAFHDHLFVTGGSAGQNLLADVQIAALAADGTLQGWSAGTPLPAPRTAHATVAYDGYLYVIGGSDGKNPLADVQVAAIASDGKIGPWASAGSFTGARSEHAALAANGNLYVVGGLDGSGKALADVQMAAIHADGTLGTWSTTGSLPSPRTRHAALAWGDDLYVVGGSDGKMLLGDAIRAPLSATGTVGAFVAAAALPSPRGDLQAVAHGGYLYLLGGCSDQGCATPIADVIAGALGPAGRIATFSAIGALPQPRAHLVAVAYDDRLYAIGGSGMNGGVLDDTAVAPLTTGGTLAPWSTLPLSVTPRLGNGMVAWHGFLYSVGGCNTTDTFAACFPIAGHLLDEVLMAPVGSDGSVGAWTATTKLPSGRWGAGVVAANGYLVVTGGCTSSACINANLADVLTAPIDPASGQVGAWRSLNTTLPAPRFGHAAAAWNDHIYVTGGCTNGDSQPTCIAMQTDVLSATIKPDGTITPWNPQFNFFPTPRFGHTVTAYDGYLYAIGGYDPNGYLTDSLSAPIELNGDVGVWTPGPPLPVGRAHHMTAAYNGNLYVVGGCNGSDLTIAPNNYLVDALVAPIGSNGQPGQWAGGPLLAPGRARAAMVAENGYLYTFGGCEQIGCDPFVPDVSTARIASAPGGIGTFQMTTKMPKTRWGHATLATSGHLYVLAGLTNLNPSPDVIVAPILDGGLGQWKLTTPFPVATWGQCAVTAHGYIYTYGGDTAPVDHNLVATGQRAQILPSGDIGSWQPVPPLPTVDVFQACTAVGDTIYITGGYDGQVTRPDIWYATVDAQGMPGPWNSGTKMPTGRVSHSVAAYGGYLFIAGGSDDSGNVRDDVISAPLNADGSVGMWQPTTSFPIARFSHTIIASDGYLYLMGGNIDITGGDVPTADILWAPILAHGTVGDWSPAGTYLPRVNETATLAGGNLYVAGGSSGSLDEIDDVQVAPLLPPAARGDYSRMIDIGFPAKTLDTLTINATPSRPGQLHLRYRTAPDTGQFGATVDKGVVAPGAKIPLGDPDARYLWVGLTLDDQTTINLTPDANGERDVAGIDLDFTDRCAGVTCTVADECHVLGVCQPPTGMCTNPTVDDGTECSSGLCEAGVCASRHGITGFACNVGSGSPTGPALLLLLVLLAVARARSRIS